MPDDEKPPTVDDEKPAEPPEADEAPEDPCADQLAADESTSHDPTSPPEPSPPDDELPNWMQRVLDAAQALPGGSRRVAVWLPTLAAGWRAAERGMEVASTVRKRLDDDEPLEWPDELAEQFGDTLREFGEALPEMDEIVPLASDLVQMGEQLVDGDKASGAVLDVTQRLEKLAEKSLQRLMELAFFAPEPDDATSRNRRLQKLFSRLEELFDRLLYLWLFGDEDTGKDP